MRWATRGQLAALGLTLRARDGLRRDERIEWCARRAGRALDSSCELTRDEARGLLAHLQHERAGSDHHQSTGHN